MIRYDKALYSLGANTIESRATTIGRADAFGDQTHGIG